MKDRIRICIEEGGKNYKVTSIYLLGDGSFKIDIPYCQHEKGVIEKYDLPEDIYTKIHNVIPRKKSESFFVKNRPQLSVHASGFVQFSGKGIISGIDKKTGKHKGLAIQSAPLTTPIGTGPTCAISFWGLKKGYETVDQRSDENFVIPSHVFKPRIFKKEIPNEYQLEIWVFPADEYYLRNIRVAPDGNEYIVLRFPNYLLAPNSVFMMRVVRLKKIPSFIALLPSMVYSRFAEEAAFGFYMVSPAEKVKDGGWKMMHAVSPAPENDAFYLKKDLPYLDYTEENK